MRRVVGTLLLAGSVLSTGCATSVESLFMRDGLKRAAFDLQCATDQIQATVLVRKGTGLCCTESQVGVMGCGKQAVYVCTACDSWLNNTASDSVKDAAR